MVENIFFNKSCNLSLILFTTHHELITIWSIRSDLMRRNDPSAFIQTINAIFDPSAIFWYAIQKHENPYSRIGRECERFSLLFILYNTVQLHFKLFLLIKSALVNFTLRCVIRIASKRNLCIKCPFFCLKTNSIFQIVSFFRDLPSFSIKLSLNSINFHQSYYKLLVIDHHAILPLGKKKIK